MKSAVRGKPPIATSTAKPTTTTAARTLRGAKSKPTPVTRRPTASAPVSPKLGLTGAEAATARRARIVADLLATGRLPVRPLIELVAAYAVPTPLTVSTLMTHSGGEHKIAFSQPHGVVAWRADASQPYSILVSDRRTERLLQLEFTQQSIESSGPLVLARFNTGAFPYSPVIDGVIAVRECIALHPTNNTVYSTESHPYRRVCRLQSNGSGGSGGESCGTLIAGFRNPNAIASGRAVKPIDHVNGIVAQFSYPTSLVATRDGHTLYVTDGGCHRIRKIEFTDPARGDECNVTTLAGRGMNDERTDHVQADGIGSNASIPLPRGLALTHGDTVLWVSAGVGTLRRIDLKTSAVTTLELSPIVKPPPASSAKAVRMAANALLAVPSNPNRLLMSGSHATSYLDATYCGRCVAGVDTRTGKFTVLAGQPSAPNPRVDHVIPLKPNGETGVGETMDAHRARFGSIEAMEWYPTRASGVERLVVVDASGCVRLITGSILGLI